MEKMSNEQIALELIKETGVLKNFQGLASSVKVIDDAEKNAKVIVALYKAILKELEG